MQRPFFNIIIATHNRSKLLERAINSILEQTYKDVNITIVSDVNDQETYLVAANKLRKNDLFIQRNGKAGPAGSRNLALKFISGSHVIFLDDDDAFKPEFLENLSNNLDILHGNRIIYVNAEIIYGDAYDTPHLVDLSHHDKFDLWVKNFAPNNCVIYPRLIAQNIEYSESMAYEDWDYLLNAASQAEIMHADLNGPIIHKNSHDTPSRGESNHSMLLECYINTYKKFPAPTPLIALKRNQLFDSLGLNLSTILTPRSING